MGVIGKVIDSLGQRLSGYPQCPKPQDRYSLVTNDMVNFSLLDGAEECGGLELREGTEGDPTPWKLHVYGLDVAFPSLEKARAWLGKPDLTDTEQLKRFSRQHGVESMLRTADTNGKTVWISPLQIMTIRQTSEGVTQITLINDATILVKADPEALAGEVFGLLIQIHHQK